MPGHDKAARLGETPRRHEKNATSEGKADDPGNRFPGRGRLGRREQPAHEPLILRATLGEVPLTGLFLPRDLSGASLAAALESLGYHVTRQKGSHIRLTTLENGEHHLTIPNHDPLRLRTLSGILKAVADHVGMSKDEVAEKLFD